jgi:site-specific DNA recombinase
MEINPMESITRCIINVRVSTDAQAKADRLSIPEQIDKCREYAAEKGWHVVALFKETFTGANLDERPEMTRVRAMTQAKAADVVLVAHTDRFSRDPIHRLSLRDEWKKVGVSRAAVKGYLSDDTRLGDAMKFMEGTHSAIELDDMVRRMGPARERKVKGDSEKGIKPRPLGNGHVDYGLQWGPERKRDGRLEKFRYVEAPETAAVVRSIFHDYDTGLSLQAISKKLQDQGIPTPTGNSSWDPVQIRNILANPHYRGEGWVHTTQVVRLPDGRKVSRPRPKEDWVLLLEGTYPKLVDDALFARVQDRLKQNRNQCPPGNRNPETGLLRRIAACGYCGCQLQVHTSKKEGITYRGSQNNRDRHGCSGYSIRADKLDEQIWSLVTCLLERPDILEAELLGPRQEDPTAAALPPVRAHLEKLSNERDRIHRRLRATDEEVLIQEYETELIALAEEIKQQESKLRRLYADRDDWKMAQEQRTGMLDYAAEIRGNLAALD